MSEIIVSFYWILEEGIIVVDRNGLEIFFRNEYFWVRLIEIVFFFLLLLGRYVLKVVIFINLFFFLFIKVKLIIWKRLFFINFFLCIIVMLYFYINDIIMYII